MRWTPWRDEADAVRLDDLAAALDAGLRPDLLFGAGRGSQGITTELEQAGLAPEPALRTVFQTAESGGRLPDAMRRRAEALRERAGLLRETLATLRYPALLIVAMLVAGSVGDVAAGRPPWVSFSIFAGIALLLGLASEWLRRVAAQRPIRPFAGLQRLQAEIRYLELLHGLYAAGVGLRDAHEQATAAIAPAWARVPFAAATLRLQGGDSGLIDALLATGALGPEVGATLTNAERIGDLEAAIHRVLGYRRSQARRMLVALYRRAGSVVTLLVLAFVIWKVVSFYSGYFGSLSRLR